MRYIIYNSINKGEFKSLQDRITNLLPFVVSYLNKYGFKIRNEADSNEILGLDFVFHDHKYHGNIGFLFDDVPNKQTFTFYVTKSFDTAQLRFFKRTDIESEVDLNYIEKNIIKILDEAMDKYNSLRDDQLTDEIRLDN